MSYSEEELLLRLLLGAVFPFAMLVALRMTRLGLRRWENGWRSQATVWIAAVLEKNGMLKTDQFAHRAISTILGVIRTVVFAAVLVVISALWFVLFPQTRPLAVELVQSVVVPFTRLVGKALGGAALLVYSALVIVGAVLLNRLISRRSVSWSPFLSLPIKAAVWLSAAFLFLLPYPGLPRVLALGLLLIAILVLFLAMRPVIEEIAAGMYLSYSLGLRPGREISIDDGPFAVIEQLRAAQICLSTEGRQSFLPYSRLLKSRITIRDAAGAGETHDA